MRRVLVANLGVDRVPTAAEHDADRRNRAGLREHAGSGPGGGGYAVDAKIRDEHASHPVLAPADAAPAGPPVARGLTYAAPRAVVTKAAADVVDRLMALAPRRAVVTVPVKRAKGKPAHAARPAKARGHARRAATFARSAAGPPAVPLHARPVVPRRAVGRMARPVSPGLAKPHPRGKSRPQGRGARRIYQG